MSTTGRFLAVGKEELGVKGDIRTKALRVNCLSPRVGRLITHNIGIRLWTNLLRLVILCIHLNIPRISSIHVIELGARSIGPAQQHRVLSLGISETKREHFVHHPRYTG